MGKSKAPKAPDPQETATAQTGTNVATAIADAFLGNVNQVTPDGSLTFDQTDTFSFNDPTSGKTFDIPRFTATQTLSEQQQALKAINDQTQSNIATVGRDQSARIGDLLGTPFDVGNEATEARLFELGSSRLNPQFARDEETLRTRLSNQGIKAGSDSFDRALNRFDERKNDAFNQLLLRGRGQAVQEGLTERNQPINEISALLSNSQVSQPSFLGAGLVVDLAARLTDTLGPAAKWAFLLGAWGAIFSSLLGVWQSVPYLFADFWGLMRTPRDAGRRHTVDTRSRPYQAYLLAIATIPAAGLWISFQQAQKIYAIVGALFIPMLAVVLLILAGQTRLVGRANRNSPLVSILLIAILAFSMLFLWLRIQATLGG